MTFKVIQARYRKWHKSIGYFLLVACSNNVSILHHFLDTTTFTVYVTVSLKIPLFSGKAAINFKGHRHFPIHVYSIYT